MKVGIQGGQRSGVRQNGGNVTTPAEFDEQLHTQPWDEVYAQHIGHPARRTLAALYSRDPATIQSAIDALPEQRSAFEEGARLLCLIELGEYQQVEQEFAVLPGLDEEAICGNMYAMAAAGVAAAERDQPNVAAARLHTAATLAGMIGATRRQQWAALEQERVNLSIGTASVARVRAALALAEPTPARLAWAREIEGAALLACGQYAEAARVSGGGVYALSRAMQHGEIAPAHADGSYGSLALAAQALISGNDPTPFLVDVKYRPEVGYAWAIRAAYSLQQGHLPDLIERPIPVDQRLIWAMLNWEALSRGDRRYGPEILINTIRESLRELDSLEPLEVIAAYAPAATAALALSPLAVPGIPDQAVLMGDHLRWRGELIRLPGRLGGGSGLLIQSLGFDWPISRAQRLRVRQAIDALNLPRQIVYVTDVARALGVMVEEGGLAWREALVRVTFAVDARAVKREMINQHALGDVMHAEHN